MKKLLLFIIIISVSCKKQDTEIPFSYPALMEVPEGFEPIVFPEDNEFTVDRWQLGKRLFYDPIMSSDSTISCANCHQAELAFSDDEIVSKGVEDRLGTRNSPTLANLAYHPYFTREGGVPTLEMQILVPIQEHNEFDFNIVLIAERLNKIPSYVEESQKAYNRDPDAFVITRALANFERSLISGNSPFDQFFYQNKKDILSEAERNGLELFFSEKTNCSSCHSASNFTNYAFENNGLYETYNDPGRFRLTQLESDRALFKVPSLRNIELTAPYMHDGSFNTLEEVIEHYQSGGKNHPNKSDLIQALSLSETEKSDLIQFLKSLTDETFISNPSFMK